MTSTSISDHLFWPTLPLHFTSRQPNKQSFTILPILKNPKLGTFFLKREQKCKCRMSSGDQTPSDTKVNIKKLVGFLYDDLPHLFDEQGIDPTAYDEHIKFQDPITKYDSISGYLLNIWLLKKLFAPEFILHWIKPSGPYEITTKWTVVMKFVVLPWKPELVLTGTSVMQIHPQTEKFNRHTDYWDSIKNNSYFSTEGLLDVIKQIHTYKTPDFEFPRYKILKRTSSYEVREYSSFVVVETDDDKLSGSTGFTSVAGNIFGKNSTQEKIKMTAPVFTQTNDPKKPKISIQIVMPSEKEISSLPDPNEEPIKVGRVEGGIAAVSKFSGKPEEDIVLQREMELRSSLIQDGLIPKTGCLLARYNDPGRTWSFMMTNEVLIWLENFSLD